MPALPAGKFAIGLVQLSAGAVSRFLVFAFRFEVPQRIRGDHCRDLKIEMRC